MFRFNVVGRCWEFYLNEAFENKHVVKFNLILV